MSCSWMWWCLWFVGFWMSWDYFWMLGGWCWVEWICLRNLDCWLVYWWLVWWGFLWLSWWFLRMCCWWLCWWWDLLCCFWWWIFWIFWWCLWVVFFWLGVRGGVLWCVGLFCVELGLVVCWWLYDSECVLLLVVYFEMIDKFVCWCGWLCNGVWCVC